MTTQTHPGITQPSQPSQPLTLEALMQLARREAALIPDGDLAPHSFAWQLKHGCLKTADAREPLFVLRAQDISAPAVVDFWAAHAHLQNVDLTKVDLAKDCADRMRRWGGPKKTPD